MKDTWVIEDDTVIAALKRNGFTCERQDEPEGPWYGTDADIAWNRECTMPDGTVLKSTITHLTMVKDATKPERKE